MTQTEILITIAMMSLGTMVTRFLPFLCFPDNTKAPALVLYLGKALPYSVMGFLVVYCLKGVSVTAYPFAAPEAAAVACVACLHLWLKKPLISIGAGTVIYMTLVQLVFV